MSDFLPTNLARTYPSACVQLVAHAVLDVVVDDEVKLLFREPVMLRLQFVAHTPLRITRYASYRVNGFSPRPYHLLESHPDHP